MKVYGELERAQLELLSSDPTPAVEGRFFWNTTDDVVRADTGAAIKTLVDTNTAQVLTGKDYDGGTASNTSRIALPKDTSANLALLTDKEALIAYDTTLGKPVFNAGSGWNTIDTAGDISENGLIENLGISVSLAAGAMTIALKQKDASTDATVGSPVKVSLRSSTAASGSFNIRSLTAASSLTIPSGATLGSNNGSEEIFFVYVLDNAGSIEPMVCKRRLNEASLHSTTALSAASDSRTVAYSTTARSNVPIRLVGFIRHTQATGGSYVTSPTEIFAGHVPRFGRATILMQDSSAQTISTTFAKITWNQTEEDDEGLVSSSTFTARRSGRHRIRANIAIEETVAIATGITMSIYIGGAAYIQECRASPEDTASLSPGHVSVTTYIPEGTTVEIYAKQQEGGTLALDSSQLSNTWEIEELDD